MPSADLGVRRSRIHGGARLRSGEAEEGESSVQRTVWAPAQVGRTSEGSWPSHTLWESLHTTLESDMVQTHGSEVHTGHKCVCGTIR